MDKKERKKEKKMDKMDKKEKDKRRVHSDEQKGASQVPVLVMGHTLDYNQLAQKRAKRQVPPKYFPRHLWGTQKKMDCNRKDYYLCSYY